MAKGLLVTSFVVALALAFAIVSFVVLWDRDDGELVSSPHQIAGEAGQPRLMKRQRPSPPVPKPIRIVGRAVSTLDLEPVRQGAILVREGPEQDPAEVCLLTEDGQFEFLWRIKGDGDRDESHITMELSLRSDLFPPPEWVLQSLSVRADTHRKEVIDVGDVPFQIRENRVWGHVVGQFPEGTTVKLEGLYASRRSRGYWHFFPKPTFAADDRFFEWRGLPTGTYQITCGVLSTEPFRVLPSTDLRRDLRFGSLAPLTGRVQLPWVTERQGLLGRWEWPHFQQEGTIDTEFVPGPWEVLSGHNYWLEPTIVLSTTERPVQRLTTRVEWDPEQECATFAFSEVPLGSYKIEVVLFDEFRVGRNLALSSSVRVEEGGANVDLDISHLLPLEVQIHDPILERDHPLHEECWAGLGGQLLRSTQSVLYTIEVIEDGGRRWPVGNVVSQEAIRSLITDPGEDHAEELEDPEGESAEVFEFDGEPESPDAIWSLLYVPRGRHTLRISRSFGWTVRKQENTVPEACAEVAVDVGPAEAIRVDLERPKSFRFQDGQSFRVDRAVGEVVIRQDAPDENGETWNVLITENEFVEWSDTGIANRITFIDDPKYPTREAIEY